MINDSYPIKPFAPTKPNRHEFNLFKSKKKNVIYRDVEANYDTIDLKECFEEQEEELPKIPNQRYWQNLSLQDIINLAPPETKLSNIILHIDMPRDLSYTDVSFTIFNRDLETEEKEYQNSLKKYEKEMKQYEKDVIEYNAKMDIYNKQIKENKIKKIKEILNKLEEDVNKLNKDVGKLNNGKL